MRDPADSPEQPPLQAALDDRSPPEGAASQEQVGRRLLIKGLLVGIPAMMTLRSGAALASSSSTHCIRNISPRTGGRCVTGSLNPPPTEPYLFKAETDVAYFNYDISGNGGGAASGSDWCVVYVDSQGVVDNNPGTFFGGTGANTNTDPGPGRFAMTQSCWASFN